MLTKNEAEEILEQAEKQNPGGWIQHSRNVAHVYDGYKFIISINEPEIAKVCLTHSFVNKSKNA